MRLLRVARSTREVAELIGQKRPERTLQALETAGYIKREYETPENIWWTTTVRGNALGGARLSRPITRATAERLLSGVVLRAQEYNADCTHLFEIAEVVVFGSYLDNAAADLGDLDISAKVRPRQHHDPLTEEFTARVLDYADESGRRFQSFLDRLSWASTEPYRVLRNRSTAIAITKEDIRQLTDRWEVVYELKR